MSRVNSKLTLLGIVALVVMARVYYDWMMQSGIGWRVWSAVHPVLAVALMLPAAAIGAWLAGRLARDWLGAQWMLPCSILGGVAATAMVNGIVGAVIGLLVGLGVKSPRLRSSSYAVFRSIILTYGLYFAVAVTGSCWATHLAGDTPVVDSLPGRLAIALAAALALAFVWWVPPFALRDHSKLVRRTVQFAVTLPIILVGLRCGIELHNGWQIFHLRNVGRVSLAQASLPTWDQVIGRQPFWDPTGVMLFGDATDTDLLRLRHCRGLQLLHIRGGTLTSEGYTALGSMPKLRHVWLVNTPFSDTNLQNLLADAAPTVLTLINTDVTDLAIPLISQWPIRSLRLENIQRTQRDSFTQLAACRTIDWLALDRVQLTDNELSALGKLATLRHLSIVNNEFEGSGLAALSGCRWLSSLDLSENKAFEDRHLHHLVPTQLSWLDLNGVRLTPRGWHAISRLRALDHLSIVRSGDDGRYLTTIIPSFNELRELAVDATSLSARATVLPVDSVKLHVAQRTVDAAEVNRLGALADAIESTDSARDAGVVLEDCELTLGAVVEIQRLPLRLFTLRRCQYDARQHDRLRDHVIMPSW